MVALVGVVAHELDDLPLQFFGRIVVLQVHHILHRAVIAFDLALGHRVVRRTVGMIVLFSKSILQIENPIYRISYRLIQSIIWLPAHFSFNLFIRAGFVNIHK